MDDSSNLKDLFLKIYQQLSRIAGALEILAQSGRPAAPNYTRAIEEYSTFDWSSIDARSIRSDSDGPTHIEWGGETWTRRSPSNKFGAAIWYSRASGKDDDGNVLYLRLITFKQLGDADPLPPKIHLHTAPAKESRPSSVSTETVSPEQPPADKQGPGEQAKPAKESNVSIETVNHGRAPAEVKKSIQEMAARMVTSGKAAISKQVGVVDAVLEEVFRDGDDQVGARRKVIQYLTGHDSMKTMPDNMIMALFMWLKPYKDSAGKWCAGLLADQEAMAILAEVREANK
jgi:hypothetical protein